MKLEATGIYARYGTHPVLQDVCLSVSSGEVIGLVGPNGSGKSTLLRVISGALEYYAGQVMVDGRLLCSLAPRDRALLIAFVPQTESVAFGFSVLEMTLMGRHAHRRAGRMEIEDYRIARESLAVADMLAAAERPATALSGGEHRRVLLARALAQRAPVLLLDEPTAHLDLAHQVELLETVRQLARRSTEPTAVVAALHDLNQAAEFCDQLVLLSHGKVEAAGTVEEVMQADVLSRVYRAHVQVGKNQLTGHPMLTVIRSTRSVRHPILPIIHVVCGGGSGSAILSALVHGGYKLSTGVLNRLDTDHQTAEALGIEVSLAPPFSGFDEHSISDARQLIMQADIVILSSVPFGHGNLANLQLVEEAQLQGKRIVLIGDEPFGSRDYANGQATILLTKIQEGGAEQYTTVEDWLDREVTNAGTTSSSAPG